MLGASSPQRKQIRDAWPSLVPCEPTSSTPLPITLRAYALNSLQHSSPAPRSPFHVEKSRSSDDGRASWHRVACWPAQGVPAEPLKPRLAHGQKKWLSGISELPNHQN